MIGMKAAGDPTGMDMREISVDDRDYWNQSVSRFGTGHLLQTFEWGEFKSQQGWQPIRLVFSVEGQIKAAALVLKRRLPLLGLSILYVPKGPCFDPEDLSTFASVLDKLKALCKVHKALFIKIDPDVTLDDAPIIETLKRAGFLASAEQIQYRNTAIVDLSLTVEKMHSNLSKSTRNYVNVARRMGVEIVEGTAADLPAYYDIYVETSTRDHFLIRPYQYYEGVWQLFLDRRMAKIFLAKYNDTVLAGCILLFLGNKVWYMYGASRTENREVRPNHFLQWHAMVWAKENGYSLYDMWGLPNILEPGQPMWGVVAFKKNLGGQVRQWIGAYDYPHFRILYGAWTRLLPRYMHFLRRIRGLPSAEPAEA